MWGSNLVEASGIDLEERISQETNKLSAEISRRQKLGSKESVVELSELAIREAINGLLCSNYEHPSSFVELDYHSALVEFKKDILEMAYRQHGTSMKAGEALGFGAGKKAKQRFDNLAKNYRVHKSKNKKDVPLPFVGGHPKFESEVFLTLTRHVTRNDAYHDMLIEPLRGYARHAVRYASTIISDANWEIRSRQVLPYAGMAFEDAVSKFQKSFLLAKYLAKGSFGEVAEEFGISVGGLKDLMDHHDLSTKKVERVLSEIAVANADKLASGEASHAFYSNGMVSRHAQQALGISKSEFHRRLRAENLSVDKMRQMVFEAAEPYLKVLLPN